MKIQISQFWPKFPNEKKLVEFRLDKPMTNRGSVKETTFFHERVSMQSPEHYPDKNVTFDSKLIFLSVPDSEFSKQQTFRANNCSNTGPILTKMVPK